VNLDAVSCTTGGPILDTEVSSCESPPQKNHGRELKMSISLMVVDDAPDLRRLIARQFARIGCAVVAEAGNCEEAVLLFDKHRPELVTLDVVMPHTGDLDAVATLKTMRALSPQVRVIVMSTTLPAQTRALFLAEGAFAFVEKPFTPATMAGLQRKIAAAFDGRNLSPPDRSGSS
jgi:two-component system chemotaxis response regulator CheY